MNKNKKKKKQEKLNESTKSRHEDVFFLFFRLVFIQLFDDIILLEKLQHIYWDFRNEKITEKKWLL